MLMVSASAGPDSGLGSCFGQLMLMLGFFSPLGAPAAQDGWAELRVAPPTAYAHDARVLSGHFGIHALYAHHARLGWRSGGFTCHG